MSVDSVIVSSVMVRDVKTAKENQTVKTVAKIMTDNNIGSVVIVENSDTHDMVEYKPIYERLSEFMLGEMSVQEVAL